VVALSRGPDPGVPIIYKICPKPLWDEAARDGIFRGSPDDLRDGFIHFSTAGQLAGTAAKHFTGQTDLMLIAVDADSLGPALVWESSRGRGRDRFPHLYGELPFTAVDRVEPLPLGGDGVHILPELLV
jgi:uncharacterized protein (DUF952 family)